MTDDELSDYVAASRAKQGLPPKVTDPVTIQRIAALILGRRFPDDEDAR